MSPSARAQTRPADPRVIAIPDADREEIWSVRYNKALDAIKKQQWDVAIPLLQTAIAIDPTPEVNRKINKGASEHYFPQYHLSIAYLKTGQIAKARQLFNARGPLPPKLAEEAKTFEQDLIKAEQQGRQ